MSKPFFNLALPYFHLAAIVGVIVLNFRVRDGNGCVHYAISTRLYLREIIRSKLDNKLSKICK